MAGPTRLILLLAAAVLLAHIAVVEWAARRLGTDSELRPMAAPLLTRMVQPQAPPPAAVAPRAKPPRPRPAPAQGFAAALPASAASTAEATQAQPSSDPQTAADRDTQTAEAPAETLAQPAGASLDTWPSDTRLTYRLDGRYREGPLYGDARVQWQREGSDYQVRLDIEIRPWASLAVTSQGTVTGQGLAPRVYEEDRRGKRRAARFGDEAITFDGGDSAPKPEGVQDTASQLVELAHRFATGRELLEVGRSVSFWMARPGGMELWTYDIADVELLQTPQFGAVQAFHLKPRPMPNPRSKVTAEMWFAPSLQYLPVRIRVSMGDTAQADLMVERIEQR